MTNKVKNSPTEGEDIFINYSLDGALAASFEWMQKQEKVSQ